MGVEAGRLGVEDTNSTTVQPPTRELWATHPVFLGLTHKSRMTMTIPISWSSNEDQMS